MPSNELYLAVLPLNRVPSRHLGIGGVTSGSVQEFLTLVGDRNLATGFFPDELPLYVKTFEACTSYLTGGHVTGYSIDIEDGNDGRKIVKVVQHVVV
jgi:hypothetical protein